MVCMFCLCVDAGASDGGQGEGGAVPAGSGSRSVPGRCWADRNRWPAETSHWQLLKPSAAPPTEEAEATRLQRSTSVQQRPGGRNCEDCSSSSTNKEIDETYFEKITLPSVIFLAVGHRADALGNFYRTWKRPFYCSAADQEEPGKNYINKF